MDEKAKQLRREYQRQYRAKNKEKINAQKREWHAKNADKVREQKRKWNRENPDKQREYKERHWERKAMEAVPTCLNCGQPFEPKRTDARYCSVNCRVYYNRNQKRNQPQ